jgi:Holliday junction resolvase RusA-like endonuclease
VSAALAHRDEGAAPSAAPVSIEFFCAGIPSTKGSARGWVVPGKGGGRPRAIITNDAGPKAKAWAAVVTHEAFAAMAGRPPLDGPLRAYVEFYLPRPKAHSTKKGLRPNRPMHSASKPDGDKLARCALDALTGVVFRDDAQLADIRIVKRYADVTVGARFTVEPIVGP